MRIVPGRRHLRRRRGRIHGDSEQNRSASDLNWFDQDQNFSAANRIRPPAT